MKNITKIIALLILLIFLNNCTNNSDEEQLKESYNLIIVHDADHTETFSYEDGTLIQIPESIQKDGFDFDGWYLDESYSEPIVFGYVIKSETTIYAKWIDIRLELNFIVQNEIIYTTKVLKNSLLSQPQYEKVGYTLEGWYLSDNNGETLIKKWFFQNDIVNGSFDLYANLVVNEYTIGFETSGSSNINTQVYAYDSPILLPNNPVLEGYDFGGWFTDLSYSEQFSTQKMPAMSFVLYAKWEPKTYEVQYKVATYGLFQNVDLVEGEYIIKSELGRNFGAALTSIGRVITWGDNISGELGIGTTRDYGTVDITLRFGLIENEVISDISLGESHTLAVTSLGRIFSWGSNAFGVLGDGQDNSQQSPVDITSHLSLDLDENIKTIKANYFRSAIITSKNRLFIWGSNFSGQIGNGTTDYSNLPIEVTPFLNLAEEEQINDVQLGWYHTGIITSNHDVYMWGKNVNGQLGNGLTTNSSIPVLITEQFILDEDDYIDKLSLGNETSSAISNKGRVFTWGSNFFQNLGLSSLESYQKGYSIKEPFEITSRLELNEDDFIIDVSIGYQHTLILSNNGIVFGMGTNSYGALGNISYSNVVDLPVNISESSSLDSIRIKQIEAYFYSTIFLGSDDLIYILGSYRDQVDYSDSTVLAYTTEIPIVFNKRILTTSISTKYGEIINPNLQDIEGYEFNGWFAERKYLTNNSLVFMPNRNITLYGYFIKTHVE